MEFQKFELKLKRKITLLSVSSLALFILYLILLIKFPLQENLSTIYLLISTAIFASLIFCIIRLYKNHKILEDIWEEKIFVAKKLREIPKVQKK